jgi:hypothetical protein
VWQLKVVSAVHDWSAKLLVVSRLALCHHAHHRCCCRALRLQEMGVDLLLLTDSVVTDKFDSSLLNHSQLLLLLLLLLCNIAVLQEKGVKLLLPTDVVVADKFDPNANTQTVSADKIPDGWMVRMQSRSISCDM